MMPRNERVDTLETGRTYRFAVTAASGALALPSGRGFCELASCDAEDSLPADWPSDDPRAPAMFGTAPAWWQARWSGPTIPVPSRVDTVAGDQAVVIAAWLYDRTQAAPQAFRPSAPVTHGVAALGAVDSVLTATSWPVQRTVRYRAVFTANMLDLASAKATLEDLGFTSANYYAPADLPADWPTDYDDPAKDARGNSPLQVTVRAELTWSAVAQSLPRSIALPNGPAQVLKAWLAPVVDDTPPVPPPAPPVAPPASAQGTSTALVVALTVVGAGTLGLIAWLAWGER